jgi:hypothetical protein
VCERERERVRGSDKGVGGEAYRSSASGEKVREPRELGKTAEGKDTKENRSASRAYIANRCPHYCHLRQVHRC